MYKPKAELRKKNRTNTKENRIALFRDEIVLESFSRKDYLQYFKEISAPTASRDLKWRVKQGILVKIGSQSLTRYKFKKDT